MKNLTLFATEDAVVSGAIFSPCRLWRYALWRRWNEDAGQMMLIGLNPSTADETKNDPTIRRCIRFARDWGYGGLLMANAYAFRATDPRDMKAAADPLGPGNLDALAHWAERSALIVAAWGVHCAPEHERLVCERIGRPIVCLGTTKGGRPRHPLYLRADTKPQPFWGPGDYP